MTGPQAGSGQIAASRPSRLRCIIFTVLGVIILFGLIILIIWLIIRPAPIKYMVEKAQTRNYYLPPTTRSTPPFDLSLQTNSHNKHISIYYDSVEVSVWRSDQMVAFTDFSPFHQPKKNVTAMGDGPTAKGVVLMGGMAKNLKREAAGWVARLEVRVAARVRFNAGAVKAKHCTMKVGVRLCL